MEFTEAELEAYLEESLDPARAAQLEKAVREDSELLERLSYLNARRDAGIHTLGEIWRRNQIGVPSIQQIKNFILDLCSEQEADYIRFRLETLKCPFTIACWKDLWERQEETAANRAESRQRKYYNSSAGLLKPRDQSP